MKSLGGTYANQRNVQRLEVDIEPSMADRYLLPIAKNQHIWHILQYTVLYTVFSKKYRMCFEFSRGFFFSFQIFFGVEMLENDLLH